MTHSQLQAFPIFIKQKTCFPASIVSGLQNLGYFTSLLPFFTRVEQQLLFLGRAAALCLKDSLSISDSAVTRTAAGGYVLSFISTLGFSLFFLKNLRPCLRRQTMLKVTMRTDTELLTDLFCHCTHMFSHDTVDRTLIFFQKKP